MRTELDLEKEKVEHLTHALKDAEMRNKNLVTRIAACKKVILDPPTTPVQSLIFVESLNTLHNAPDADLLKIYNSTVVYDGALVRLVASD